MPLGEAVSVWTQESGCWDWLDGGEFRRHQSRRGYFPKSAPDGKFNDLHLPVLCTSLRSLLRWVPISSIPVSACYCGLE